MMFGKRYRDDEEALGVELTTDPARRYDHDDAHSSDEQYGLMNGDQDGSYSSSRPSQSWVNVFKGIDRRTRRSAKASKPFASRLCRQCGIVLLVFMLCLGVLQLVTAVSGAYHAFFPGHFNRPITDWEQIGKTGDGLKHYPTDFTRGVIPIACHSHNDYWRAVPLFSGISAGCISTEADVWLQGSDLLVGHDESSLTHNRTLRSLYVDPLVDILARQNPTTDYMNGSKTMNGVFDTNPRQVFTLLIDFKRDGVSTFKAVLEALEPLRSEGYLTYVNDTGDVIERPVRVVGTGNTPFQSILSGSENPHKDFFFDAPIGGLDSETQRAETSKESAPGYRPSNSYYASGSFADNIGYMWGWSLTSDQLSKLRAQIKAAHDRGLKARYWETPAWPISRRNALWTTLVEEGADILNVDDLKGAAYEDWRRNRL